MKKIFGFAIAAAMTFGTLSNNANAFDLPNLKHPAVSLNPHTPTDSGKIERFKFSLTLPKRKKGEIAAGLSQVVIDYMLFKNGCTETDPTKLMQKWFEQRNVPVDIHSTRSSDRNGLRWFVIGPKNPKNQQAFDNLMNAFDNLTQLPNGPMHSKDLGACKRGLHPNGPVS